MTGLYLGFTLHLQNFALGFTSLDGLETIYLSCMQIGTYIANELDNLKFDVSE